MSENFIRTIYQELHLSYRHFDKFNYDDFSFVTQKTIKNIDFMLYYIEFLSYKNAPIDKDPHIGASEELLPFYEKTKHVVKFWVILIKTYARYTYRDKLYHHRGLTVHDVLRYSFWREFLEKAEESDQEISSVSG